MKIKLRYRPEWINPSNLYFQHRNWPNFHYFLTLSYVDIDRIRHNIYLWWVYGIMEQLENSWIPFVNIAIKNFNFWLIFSISKTFIKFREIHRIFRSRKAKVDWLNLGLGQELITILNNTGTKIRFYVALS